MAALDSEPRAPEDFSSYLATKEPLLVVGGQAVNLWALFYSKATAELAPFVSRDVDVLGDRNTLKEIAALAGLKPNFFSLKPPSNEVGYIAPKDASDQPLLIEVLRWVNGVKEEELLADAVIFAIGQAQVPVRVPSPVSLLKAKLANLHSINQRGRQDSKHVMILFRVIPLYLKDLIQSVGKGRRTERQVVNILGRLLDVVTAETVAGIFEALKLEPRALFDRLPSKDLPKVLAFKTHQLSRLLS
jgi:hypothetical protein